MKIKVLFKYSPEEKAEGDEGFVGNEDDRWSDVECEIDSDIRSALKFYFPEKKFDYVEFDYA